MPLFSKAFFESFVHDARGAHALRLTPTFRAVALYACRYHMPFIAAVVMLVQRKAFLKPLLDLDTARDYAHSCLLTHERNAS